MSSTRDLAREAAFEMLMEGTKPSVQKIREKIRQGSDKTILDGLNEFWDELGQLIQDWRTYPKLPNELAKTMNEWWHLAMKQAHSSLDAERKEMKIRISEAENKKEAALLEKQESKKSLDNLLQVNDELTTQLNELDDKFQIQLHDNTKVVSENISFKKEIQKLNKQLSLMDGNHKEAIKLSYDRALETEQNYAKQIDSWKIQADKSQSILLGKEKEWKLNDNNSSKKFEKLYKRLNESEETIQNKTHEVERLTMAIDDNQKSIQHFTQQIKMINNVLTSKDNLIDEQQSDINKLNQKLETYQSKENILEESQKKLDIKFNQLLETIKSQG